MKNYKSLAEQIADKLIFQLEKHIASGTENHFSEHPLSVQPVNAATGKNYKGLNAIWLALQGNHDPRWVTLRQAKMNNWEVDKKAKPVLITFTSYSERKAVKGEDGKNLRDENGKMRYERINRPEATTENAWVFNASQVKGMPKLSAFVKNQPDPGEIGSKQAERFLYKNGAEFVEGSFNRYDPKSDRIVLADKPDYAYDNPVRSVYLKLLAHWTGHESRLNREMSAGPGTPGFAAENLRGTLASILFSSQLYMSYGFEMDGKDAKHLIDYLKSNPNAVQSAADDAKKIVAYVNDLEQQRFEKHIPEVWLVPKSAGFVLNEQIHYKDKQYVVTRLFKNGRVEVQDLSSKQKVKMDKTDGLYSNLLEARNNPALQVSLATSSEVKAASGIPVIPNEQQQTASIKMKR